MSKLRKQLSSRYLAILLTAALVASISLTLLSFDQLGGVSMFTGHAVADMKDAMGKVEDGGVSSSDHADVISNYSGVEESPPSQKNG